MSHVRRDGRGFVPRSRDEGQVGGPLGTFAQDSRLEDALHRRLDRTQVVAEGNDPVGVEEIPIDEAFRHAHNV